MDPGYLAALHRTNVDMITDPIATITKEGIRGKSGKEYEFDVLIRACLSILSFSRLLIPHP